MVPEQSGVATHGEPADESTRLSQERTALSIRRTKMSAERTLMSWVRTSFSLISFGFTIGKFLQYLSEQPGSGELGGRRLVPILLIVLGLAAMIVGAFEFRRNMLEIEAMSGAPHRIAPVAVLTLLVFILGLLAFAGLFTRGL